MVAIIINDCQDANAVGRQKARILSLLDLPALFIGVSNDLEAAGNLIDALDAVGDQRGVILVNTAPRHGVAKRWGNGAPFVHFRYKDVLVVATIGGATLSLAKKFGLADFVRVIDIPTALDEMIRQRFLRKQTKSAAIRSQFRSYEFLPYIAAYLLSGRDVPGTEFKAADIPNVPHAIWWVDNFGNCKTTILPEEVPFKAGGSLVTNIGKLACFSRLSEVPDGETAVIVGSSGLGERRFLEIVIQGGDAADHFRLSSGDVII